MIKYMSIFIVYLFFYFINAWCFMPVWLRLRVASNYLVLSGEKKRKHNSTEQSFMIIPGRQSVSQSNFLSSANSKRITLLPLLDSWWSSPTSFVLKMSLSTLDDLEDDLPDIFPGEIVHNHNGDISFKIINQVDTVQSPPPPEVEYYYIFWQ